jgi:hypothetical protein
MKKPLFTFAGVLALAGMLQFSVPAIPVRPVVYWGIAIAAAALLALAARAPAGGGGLLRRGEFLCDTCKYNDPRDCSRPERPNATSCPDYRGR